MESLNYCKMVICGLLVGLTLLITPSIAGESKSLPEFAVMALDYYPESFDAPVLRVTPVYRIDEQVPVYESRNLFVEVVPHEKNWSLREQLIPDELIANDFRNECCSEIVCEGFLNEDMCGIDSCCIEEECCCCCNEELTGLAFGGGGGSFGGAAFGFGGYGGYGGGGGGHGKDHKEKDPKVKIPEPSTWLLLGGMLVVVAYLKRRKSLV